MSLRRLLEPRSVAVVGASARRGSVGNTIVKQLASRFRGRVYPVNPKYDVVEGLKCYPSLLDIPDDVDIVVIAVAAHRVPRIMSDACRKGASIAIIVSGGFSEVGGEGRKLEEQVKSIARSCGIRVIGPNCIGVLDNASGLDTFFLPEERMARPRRGPLSFVSQSGALLSVWLDKLARMGVGVSKAISYGNAADVNESDLLEVLGEDEETRTVAVYIEGVKDGRRFMSVIKSLVSKGKSVVVLKGGRTWTGARAVSSHTASLAGSYEVYRAALRQCGAVVVEDQRTLLNTAIALSLLGPRSIKRLLIVTDAGGQGVLAADYADRLGFRVDPLPEEARRRLEKLPPHYVKVNPVDLTGDSDDEKYRFVLEQLLPLGVADAVLVITSPMPPARSGRVVDYVIEAWREYGIPIVTVVTGSGSVADEWRRRLIAGGVPAYETPEEALLALAGVREAYRLGSRLRALKA